MSGLQYSKDSQTQIVPNHILFKSHSKINLKLLKLSHLCTSETSERNLRNLWNPRMKPLKPLKPLKLSNKDYQ
jgi:hypothetical protein